MNFKRKFWNTAVFHALTVSASLASPGGQPSATIDFSQDAPSELVAPVGIWFRATGHSGFTLNDFSLVGNAYDPAKHQVFHVWDFDDPGSFANANLNIPTAWNNSGVDYNHDAYHCFDTPGSYDVSLWAVDSSGNVGEVTKTVTILDPDTVFTGTRTICVSGSSNFTGKPTGAQEVTTISAALSAAAALAPTSCRILLRRGETFKESNTINSPLTSVRIGDFGTGAKPILQPPDPVAGTGNGIGIAGMATGNSVGQMTFYNLDLQGDWDATTETGVTNQGSIGFGTQNTTDYNALFYRLNIDGFSDALSAANDNVDFTVGVVDCHLTNWRVIGMFMVGATENDNQRFAIVGTSVHSPQNCCIGNRGGGYPLGQINGTVRYGDLKNFITSATSFYNASGDLTPNLQPCLRLAQSGNQTQKSFNVFMNRTYVEGGSVAVGIDGMNGSITEWPSNIVLDMIIVVSCYGTYDWIQTDFGGATIRNCFTYNPTIASRVATSGLRFINNTPETPGAGNYDAPITITHNTFVNTDNRGAIPDVVQTGAWVNNTTTDNVNHQPNNSLDADVDLLQNISGVQTLNEGRRISHARPTATASSVSNGQSFTCSYPAGTSAADFSGGTRHGVSIGGNFWYQHFGHCTFTFGGSEITVTNNSGATMDGTATLFMEQTTLATDTAYGSPDDIPLPRLDTGAAALLAGDPGPLTDLLAAIAPGASETGFGPDGVTSRASTGRHAGAVQDTT